jgi:hypothetical protein
MTCCVIMQNMIVETEHADGLHETMTTDGNACKLSHLFLCNKVVTLQHLLIYVTIWVE